MGRIMLATSASTDEEYGGTIATKADEVEPVSVLSIPANTYNTYALALSALETAFNALSADNKKKAIIVQNDDMVLSIQSIGFKSFTKEYVYDGVFYVTTLNLASHKLEEARVSSSYVYNDYSSITQSQKLELIIV